MTTMDTGMARHAAGGEGPAAVGGAGLGVRVWGRFRGNPTRWAGRALLLAWAGFWTWFIGAHFVSEGWTAAGPGGSMLGAIWALVAVALRWPRVGSVVLLGASGFAFWFFNNNAAWALMAAPMAVAALLMPWERRS